MSEDAPAKSTRSLSFSWIYWSLWACLLVFIIYPLSTGPVILLIQHTGADESLIGSIYAPLMFLSNSFEPVEDFLIWYFDLWGIW